MRAARERCLSGSGIHAVTRTESVAPQTSQSTVWSPNASPPESPPRSSRESSRSEVANGVDGGRQGGRVGGVAADVGVRPGTVEVAGRRDDVLVERLGLAVT